jgi:hypothetical protein
VFAGRPRPRSGGWSPVVLGSSGRGLMSCDGGERLPDPPRPARFPARAAIVAVLFANTGGQVVVSARIPEVTY